jgi:hypothetical protein
MVGKTYLGAELEKSYAKILGGTVTGGLNDCGIDVVFYTDVKFAVQVRSSVPFALKFLQESIRRHRFIPICVGEPGGREEMLASLAQFGGWVGHEIPRRQEVLEGIRRVRELCGT